MSFEVLIPVPVAPGDPGAAEGAVPPTALADRVGGAGLTLGLMHNSKPKSEELLTAIAKLLERRRLVAAVGAPVKTEGLFLPSEEQFDAMVAAVDVVLVGLGDCSSCSACSVHVAIDFERRGIPAAAICTKPFFKTATAMAMRQGVANFGFAMVEHPVASLDEGGIRQRAEEALPQVLSVLGIELPAAAGQTA